MKTKTLFQIVVALVLLASFLPGQTIASAAGDYSGQANVYNAEALKATIQIIRNMDQFKKIVAGARADIGMPYGDRGNPNSNPGYGPWKYQYGKCTDSVIDSFVAAGVVSGWGVNGPSGYPSLRNVGNMFNYFKAQQTILGMSEPWLPGDVAFFAASNESDDAPGAHVEIVIAVDDQGNPTRVINAGNSKGAYERNYYQQFDGLRVTRHGRLTTLHNLFLATYSAQLSGGTKIGCMPTANQVAFFLDVNYTGQCIVKDVGNFSNASAMGMPNDSISSIKVGNNVKVTLCQHNDYASCETFAGNDPDLRGNAIGNDQASSAKVERLGCAPNAYQVALFLDVNYTGQCIVTSHLTL
jgi:hypothetical protein